MSLWRYSARDALLPAVSAAQLAFNLWLAATWSRHGWAELCWLWPTGVLLFWYNAVVVTHNFIHTPWFAGSAANRLYAAGNSVNLGVPLMLCRFHHLNHHRYGNDRPDAFGRTRDRSSTYRFGRNGAPEGPLMYGLLGLIRGGTAEAWRDAARSARRGQFWGEATACALGLATYATLSWRYVLGFYVPVFYAGSMLGILTNYYQHAGASPTTGGTDAVSCYGRLYNRLCFNEGYHREHHLRPSLHWSRRVELRASVPSTGCAISPVPPVIGFLATNSVGPAGDTRPPGDAPTERP